MKQFSKVCKSTKNQIAVVKHTAKATCVSERCVRDIHEEYAAGDSHRFEAHIIKKLFTRSEKYFQQGQSAVIKVNIDKDPFMRVYW